MKPFQSDLQEISTMLVVSDLVKSERFYTNYLGFETVESIQGLRRLKREHFYLYLITFSPPTSDRPDVSLEMLNHTEKTNVNLVFRVRDCNKVYSELRKNGLTFLTEPQSPSWGGRRVFTRDPDGYLIEFEQAE
jgi:catechol 2,3-dioxygenase-like lactoylglutathione lyase family enzyme